MSLELHTYKLVNVIQGDYAVSDDPEVLMTTILGSCVAVCLHDPIAGIGGMNHFLLPGNLESSAGSMSCGLNMMELLINALQKKGALRNNLRAKVFGGSDMLEGMTKIGEKNCIFAREFLAYEGIPILAQSLGGTYARNVRFWPASGHAKQKEVTKVPTMAPAPILKKPEPVSDDVEFF